ncbi:MAG: hypothetical protein MUE46_04290 [Xanthomonadales bacterium]|jgi:hypothetical protein|nr:hypothetical protein [Xanthomonadales bacterium]
MPKNLRLVAMLCCLAAAPAYAEKIDCESLAGVSDGLNQIADGLHNGEDVDEQLYSDLGNVLDIVHAVADEENNVRLDQALDDVEAAYADNDRDGFVNALDRIVELFDAFYTADCDA